jgi:hypothetical protein
MAKKSSKILSVVLGLVFLLIAGQVLAAGMGRGRGRGAAGQPAGPAVDQPIAQNQIPANRANQEWIQGYRQGFADGLRFALNTGQRLGLGQGLRQGQPAPGANAPNAISPGQEQGLQQGPAGPMGPGGGRGGRGGGFRGGRGPAPATEFQPNVPQTIPNP